MLKARLVSSNWYAQIGSLGGKARMASLTAEQRSELSRKGAAGYLGRIPVEERRRIALMGVRARMILMTATERSAVGRLGARARMEKLSPERRREIASKAGKSRWEK